MEFCRVTSLHGLKYVGQMSSHFLERVFFGIAFVLGVVASVYLSNQVWTKYINSPVIVAFRETEVRIDNIPFPSVTICNVNNIRKSHVLEFLDARKNAKTDHEVQLALMNLHAAEHVCEATSPSFAFKFEYAHPKSQIELPEDFPVFDEDDGNIKHDDTELDIKKFLEETTQPCSEMILLCMWLNHPVDCAEIFQPTVSDYGTCCTFNMSPTALIFKDYNGTLTEDVQKWNGSDLSMESLLAREDDLIAPPEFPRRVEKSGLSNGLSVLLDPDINEYYCTASDSTGFQTITHLPNELANLAELGDAISPNMETFVRISADVTTADEEIEALDAQIRKCYFTGEFTLAYFKHYTTFNCFDECITNITFFECGCIRYYMPRDKARKLCGHPGIACARNLTSVLPMYEKFGRYCGCLPTCTDIAYVSHITTRPLRSDISLWENRMVNHSAWSERKVSLMHVFFGEDSTYPKIRKRLYGVTDLIANIGGLLGLCLGFSVLSAVELLYFMAKVFGKYITTRICCADRGATVGVGDDVKKIQRSRNDGRAIPIIVQPLNTGNYGYWSNYYPTEIAGRYNRRDGY